MGPRLTDEKKKAVLADYLIYENFSAVSKLHGVSDQTVRRLVNDPNNVDFIKQVEIKRAEQTQDILAYMETQKTQVNRIIGAYLDKLLDPVMMEKATPSQLTTALGTLIDKFTMSSSKASATQREDDPLTKSLKEEAERMNNGNLS